MHLRKVIVAGAGLAGLAVAQGLRRAGVEVAVYERDRALDDRRQGYRLHLDAGAWNALAAVLPPPLFDLLRATSGTPLPQFTMYDLQLRVLQVQRTEGPGAAYERSVDRATLRGILLTAVEESLHLGKEIVGFERTASGGVAVHFADGDRAEGDVLIGADGIGSAVRRQHLPEQRIVDTGVWQLYGRLPLTSATRPLFQPGMFGVFSAVVQPAGPYLGMAPVEFAEDPAVAARRVPGVTLPSVPSYMTCSLGARSEWFDQPPEELRRQPGPSLHRLMTRAVETWHPSLRAIVDACEPDSLFAIPLRTSVPIPAWDPSPVTFAGDAIHAMSPAAGAGACTALQDAERLVAALVGAARGEEALVDAIAGYEREVRLRGFEAVRRAAANGVRVLGQNPLPSDDFRDV